MWIRLEAFMNFKSLSELLFIARTPPDKDIDFAMADRARTEICRRFWAWVRNNWHQGETYEEAHERFLRANGVIDENSAD
jgi:hypothetical protein